MHRYPVADAPHPIFTSDRLQLLGILITAETLALSRWRVTTGESLYHCDRLRSEITPEQGRVALILTLEMNPRAILDCNEQGLLRGVSRKTYATMLAAGEIDQ